MLLITGHPALLFGYEILLGTQTGNVVVGAGQQHGPGRSAGGRHMEIRKPQSGICQRIDIRGFDLTSERPEVGVAEVISKDQQKN